MGIQLCLIEGVFDSFGATLDVLCCAGRLISGTLDVWGHTHSLLCLSVLLRASFHCPSVLAALGQPYTHEMRPS